MTLPQRIAGIFSISFMFIFQGLFASITEGHRIGIDFMIHASEGKLCEFYTQIAKSIIINGPVGWTEAYSLGWIEILGPLSEWTFVAFILWSAYGVFLIPHQKTIAGIPAKPK